MTIAVAGGTTTGSLSETALSGGDTTVDFISPGAGNTGYVDTAVDLTGLGLDYLLYDWDGVDQLSDGDVFDDFPQGRATFGIYRGAPRIIQIRDPRM